MNAVRMHNHTLDNERRDIDDQLLEMQASEEPALDLAGEAIDLTLIDNEDGNDPSDLFVALGIALVNAGWSDLDLNGDGWEAMSSIAQAYEDQTFDLYN